MVVVVLLVNFGLGCLHGLITEPLGVLLVGLQHMHMQVQLIPDLYAGNIYAPGSTLGMQSMSIYLRGAASDGSGDQLLGSLTGTANGPGVPTLQLAAASGTSAVPQGGEPACLHCHSQCFLVGLPQHLTTRR